ncbi:MAG TPA: glycosyltransferase family 39 protein [Bryobacteraceae bacterium]|nr:glycosyltransferase family 39 protein [Bryobacteraceae bacterium]
MASLPVEILAAAFALAICYALGLSATHVLALPLTRTERHVYALTLGAALTSLMIWCLGMLHALYREVFAALLVLSVAGAFTISRRIPYCRISSSPWPLWQRVIFFSVYLTFGLSYLLVALAPEVSPDGSRYHLGLIARALRQHAFTPLATSFYAGLPQGAESIYMIAFAFGGHSAAALVQYAYWMLLPWIALCLFQRMNRPLAGLVAGILLFTSPLVAMDGTSAYVDVFLMSALAAAFALTERSLTENSFRFGVAAGMVAGFAVAIKYTAYPAPIYVAGVLAWAHRRIPRSAVRFAAGSLTAAAVIFIPWTVRNLFFYRNPLFPFASAVFANPYMHAWSEHLYRVNMHSYAGIHSVLQLPWELTVHGDLLQGLIGPVFLLLPAGLLAARYPEGRRMLFAGCLLFVPYMQNIGARFFLPSLVFFGCALALAFADFVPAAVLLVSFAAITAWPNVYNRYCRPNAGRIYSFPKKVILGRETRETFRRRALGDLYEAAKLLDEHVAPGTRVLTLDNIPDAYTTAEVATSYQAALNERLYRELLFAAQTRSIARLRFRVPMGNWRSFRLVHQHSDPRVWAGICEIDDATSSTASPNPFDVRLAADGNFATCWSTWAPPPADTHVDFTPRRPLNKGSTGFFTAYVPWDQSPSSWQLLGTSGGIWEVLDTTPHIEDFPVPANLRAEALRDLLANDFYYLLTRKEEALEKSISSEPPSWPVHLIGIRDPYRLYQITLGNRPGVLNVIDRSSLVRNAP